MYNKLPEKPTVFFDVDNTLVFAWSDIDDKLREELLEIEFGGLLFYQHTKHIAKLQEFKARGHNVVVWSAGGADWAAQVVEKLHLGAYVDVVMSKPHWYFDDLPVEEWIGRRCYVKLNDSARGF